MVPFLEKFKVRLMVAVTWKVSKNRLLQSLANFAATEADSAWHLAHAASRAADPDTRADLFGQVLEEMRHADEFTRLAKAMSETAYKPVKMERNELFPDPSEQWRFYAYCHVGEHAAAERFKHIHDALPEGDLKQVLKGILRDEALHVHGAGEMMAATGKSPQELARAERSIKLRRAKEAWLRAGRNIADVASSAILQVVYLLVGVIGARGAKRRLITEKVPCPVTPSASATAFTMRPLPSSETGG